MIRKLIGGKVLTIGILCVAMALVLWTASPVRAAGDVDQLKGEIQALEAQMKALQEKLSAIEKAAEKDKAQAEETKKRLDKAELHTATDKVSLGVELRSKAESLHYDDIRVAPGPFVNSFFTPATQGGFNGVTLAQARQAMAQMQAAGMIPPAEATDADNDIVFTNKFRLNMNAKVNDQLTFAGRLAAYKVWGDSTGVKFNGGSLGDVTFDGNTSSLPHGDTIRLERAYFNYKQDIGAVPINFSLGRRPSTDGPPMEYGEYGLEGGSPLATIINWQFDGASLNFGLEDVTGIPGAAFKLCYGVGFEGDWGNSYSLTDTEADVEDVHLFGFIATFFDNDQTSAVLNYAHAWDITDGFTGLTVMPFIVSKQDTNGDGAAEYNFAPNSGGFISRLEPSTNIGDWDAASLLFRTNFSDYFANIDAFLGLSWSHTDPSSISQNPYYELMGMGLLSSNGDLEARNGYGIYAGMLFPMPLDARLGLEYNWGSKYWFNFTGAEDSLVGSKLATRGSVYEAYYIQPIFSHNFFVKLGTQYYDYEYTGSGNPLGEPVKIDDATALDALNAVNDKVWTAYISATLRW
jgi:hypothetical protein